MCTMFQISFQLALYEAIILNSPSVFLSHSLIRFYTFNHTSLVLFTPFHTQRRENVVAIYTRITIFYRVRSRFLSFSSDFPIFSFH